MKILVTGSDGYIGCVAAPFLANAGHDVTGMDSFLFADCSIGPEPAAIPTIRADVRDIDPSHLRGFDAVVHLAGISNDPLGDLSPNCTLGINYRASVRVAQLAKAAGVERFVFASSCSTYGAQGDGFVDETGSFNPVTPYGWSKVLAEAGISALADDNFSPVFLRNATAYGMSARLRIDLVVNNLVGYGITRGEVVLKSDGRAWRPLVHIEDIARAVRAVLEAPRELVHDEVFNVGATDENYLVRDVASLVGDLLPGTRVVFADGAGADLRNYRVNCDKIREVLPAFQPAWTVPLGIEELRDALASTGLGEDELMSGRYLRIKHVQEMQRAGLVDSDLRWNESVLTRASA